MKIRCLIGGPLISEDGSVLGVTSLYINFEDSIQVRSAVFTNVPYYYDWIEKVTGLKLPEHHGRQA